MASNIKLSFISYFLLYLSLAVITVESNFILRKISERYYSTTTKDNHALSCNCSNGSVVEENVDRVTADEILSGDLKCDANVNACKLLSICTDCKFYFESCQPSKEDKKHDCVKDTYMLKDGFFNQSIVEEGIHNRFKRTLRNCPYPSNLKTADLFCKLTPKKVTCSQSCILGYTLKSGKKLLYRCRKSENKWEPHNFKECRPYVDCTVSLTSAGAADCYTPTTKSPATCYIKCHKYEDKQPVPRRSYTCKHDGKWNKPLPFCAKAGSNIALVKPPKEYL